MKKEEEIDFDFAKKFLIGAGIVAMFLFSAIVSAVIILLIR